MGKQTTILILFGKYCFGAKIRKDCCLLLKDTRTKHRPSLTTKLFLSVGDLHTHIGYQFSMGSLLLAMLMQTMATWQKSTAQSFSFTKLQTLEETNKTSWLCHRHEPLANTKTVICTKLILSNLRFLVSEPINRFNNRRPEAIAVSDIYKN